MYLVLLAAGVLINAAVWPIPSWRSNTFALSAAGAFAGNLVGLVAWSVTAEGRELGLPVAAVAGVALQTPAAAVAGLSYLFLRAREVR